MDPGGGRLWHVTTDIPDEPLGRRLIIENHGVVQAPGFVRSVKAEDHDPLVDVSVSRANCGGYGAVAQDAGGQKNSSGRPSGSLKASAEP